MKPLGDIIQLEKDLTGTDALFLEPRDVFDKAIIGSEDNKIVYSEDIILDVLMESEKWTYDEALEYYEFNIECAYMGNGTPIYLNGSDICT